MAKKKSESAASSDAAEAKKKELAQKPTAKKEGARAQAAQAKSAPAESAKKQPAAKPVAKKEARKPTGAPQSPLIDTNLAANAAAAMVGGRVSLPSAGSGQPRKESGMFKQLKAGLNKPAAGALGGAFGVAGQNKKSNLPHHGGKQVGQNQTFGADVTRSGVPRRTPG